MKISLIVGATLLTSSMFTGCNVLFDDIRKGISSTASTIGGVANKGPYQKGATVTAYKLVNGVRDMNVTSTILDNDGSYSISIPWTNPTEIVVSGEYINEKGTKSKGALNAVTIPVANKLVSLRPNVATMMAAAKTKKKLIAGTPPAQAQTESSNEVKQDLGLPAESDLEELNPLDSSDITNAAANTKLLEISAAISQSDDPAKLIEQLADGGDEGKAALETVKEESKSVNLDVVANNMNEALKDAGVENTNVPTETTKTNELNGKLEVSHTISIDNLYDQELNSAVISENITINSLIGGSGNVSIGVDANFSVNGGTFTTSETNVSNGDTIRIKTTTSSSYLTGKDVTITIGGTAFTYTATTKSDPFVADTTPTAFDFGYVLDQVVSTDVNSSEITISGINTDSNISTTNGTAYKYIDTSDTWQANPTTVVNGDKIKVGHTTNGALDAESNTSTVTIGGVDGTFTSFTQYLDKAFDSVSFVDAVDVNYTSTPTVTSGTITISGINTNLPITISDGNFSIDGGTNYITSGTITASAITDTTSIKIQASAPTTYATTKTVNLTIGDSVIAFKITTMTDPIVPDSIPNSFAFVSKYNQITGATVESAPITISGINQEVNMTVAGGGSTAYKINNSSWTTAAADITIKNEDNISLQHVAASTEGGSVESNITIGDFTATFTSFTKVFDRSPNTSEDAFSLTNFKTERVAAGETLKSDAITIDGSSFDATDLVLSISGDGNYSINGGTTYITSATTLVPDTNYTIILQQNAASVKGDIASSKITIGDPKNGGLVLPFDIETKHNAYVEFGNIVSIGATNLSLDNVGNFTGTVPVNSESNISDFFKIAFNDTEVFGEFNASVYDINISVVDSENSSNTAFAAVYGVSVVQDANKSVLKLSTVADTTKVKVNYMVNGNGFDPALKTITTTKNYSGFTIDINDFTSDYQDTIDNNQARIDELNGFLQTSGKTYNVKIAIKENSASTADKKLTPEFTTVQGTITTTIKSGN